jgi:RNA polymerase sigma-70 factor (ECF subfamily)
MNSQSDRTLLERLPEDEAVRELINRHSRMVYAASYRILRDADQADDAVQSVFLTMLGRAHELTRHVSLAGWLYVAAIRTSLAMTRSEAARRKRERIATTRHPQPSAPNDLVAYDLVNAIAKLNEADREVVLLRYGQDLTHEEIGLRVNLSTDAVRMRLDRAMSKLKGRLAPANLLTLLPIAFAPQQRSNPSQSPTFQSGAWKNLTPKNRPLNPPFMRVPIIAGMTVILTGAAVWYGASGAPSKAGPAPAPTLPPGAVPAKPYMDGDCVIKFEPRHAGKDILLEGSKTESTTYGQHIDMVNWAPGGVIDGIVIPHLDETGKLTCDFKAYVRRSNSDVVTIKEQLGLPILATYAPASGKPFYAVITVSEHPSAKCYANASDFQAAPNDDVYVVTATRQPGRTEDRQYWANHLAGGPFGDTVVSTKPVSETFEVTVFQNDKEIETQRVKASNRECGRFSYVRPVGIRCEIDVTPDIRPDGMIDDHLEYWEFTDPNTPNATKQTFTTGHGARYGMMMPGASLAMTDVWIVRSTTDPMQANMDIVNEPQHKPTDIVFRVKAVGGQ